MVYRYAQIDDDGLVISDSYLSGEVNSSNMIPIAQGFDLTNKKYVDGEWVEYTPPTPTPSTSQPTLTDIQENQLIIMEALADIDTKLLDEEEI